jgi:lipid-A-disaccharide synthase
LRLARKLKGRGIRNAYYICPQFWAWRPWRVRVVRRRFAQALCIFPFEESFYGDAGVPVKFIGHPLVGNVSATRDRVELCGQTGLDPAEPLVAVLPGSRAAELRQHLPVLREACRHIQATVPKVQFIVAGAPGGGHGALVDLGEGWDSQLKPRVLENRTYDALAACDTAIVSSGTATVEAALLDAPMVVVYRVTPLTAALAKPLVRTKFFSMVNLIADKRIVPELIQENFTPDKVADAAIRLLQDKTARRAMRAGLAEVRRRLGPPGAVDRAADALLALIKGRA